MAALLQGLQIPVGQTSPCVAGASSSPLSAALKGEGVLSSNTLAAKCFPK